MSRFIRSALVVAAALSLSTGLVACDKKGKDDVAKKGDKKAGDKKADKKADDKKADDKKADDKKADDKKADDKKADDKAAKPADAAAKPADDKAAKPADDAAAKPADDAAAKPADAAAKPADAAAKPADAAAKPADAAAKPADAAAKPADAAAKAADAKATFVKFEIDHTDKAKGLVKGEFNKFEVKDVVVDLKDLTKSKATIEIDLSSIVSGIAKRDTHLKSPDFFDVAKFAKATVMISKVGPAKDGAHPAEAKFSLHGVEKTFPVSFKIVETKADGSIVVEGELALKRSDYKVGGAPDKAGAVDDAKVMVRLHLK